MRAVLLLHGVIGVRIRVCRAKRGHRSRDTTIAKKDSLPKNEGNVPRAESSTFSERVLCHFCAPLLVNSLCRCETPLQACPLYLKTNKSCELHCRS